MWPGSPCGMARETGTSARPVESSSMREGPLRAPRVAPPHIIMMTAPRREIEFYDDDDRPQPGFYYDDDRLTDLRGWPHARTRAGPALDVPGSFLARLMGNPGGPGSDPDWAAGGLFMMAVPRRGADFYDDDDRPRREFYYDDGGTIL